MYFLSEFPKNERSFFMYSLHPRKKWPGTAGFFLHACKMNLFLSTARANSTIEV